MEEMTRGRSGGGGSGSKRAAGYYSLEKNTAAAQYLLFHAGGSNCFCELFWCAIYAVHRVGVWFGINIARLLCGSVSTYVCTSPRFPSKGFFASFVASYVVPRVRVPRPALLSPCAGSASTRLPPKPSFATSESCCVRTSVQCFLGIGFTTNNRGWS